ncbi:MAG: phosphatidate cytidylyltransferase [Cyanobacteria bacterium J06621_11]
MQELLSLTLNLISPMRCSLFLGSIISLWIVTGILKEKQQLCESDSRKINHIAVFVGGALVFGWLPETAARANLHTVATIILMLIITTCCYPNIKPFSYIYAANARASDAPHTTFFFLFSWVVSIAALAIIDLLFANMVVTRMAILIVGVADGIAEPIGKRFGRHRYAVLSFGKKPVFRSLEGSLAVWIGTVIVVLCASAHSYSPLNDAVSPVVMAIITASVVAIVEALSPRGCDNFTLLLTAASLTNMFLPSGILQ